MPKKNESQFEKLAKDSPIITVLSDHPLPSEEFSHDAFELVYRMGPVYDIIRHRKTKTPMAIAVYGDWGSGKTSAMRWLDGLLHESNKHAGKSRVKVSTVWFYPWKYHTKEDVWRGLISEVIIKSIDVSGASPAKVVNAAKQFGMFLGRAFVHAIAGLTLKAKDPAGIAEAEVKLDGIKDILADYRETTHPERAYLNDFENGLKEWISATIGEDERMVIFIDDLDRCMPDIALEVLEALKLYLNIPGLLFVVGVEPGVINELVKKYYEKLGVDQDKSGHYLAKMFQAEVTVSPHERQIGEFLIAQLGTLDLWGDEKKLPADDRAIFEAVFLNLARNNPREVKRLINSALMAAAGFDMVPQGNPPVRFNQALQVHLVGCVLDRKYRMGWLVRRKRGDDFFAQWSAAVRATRADNPELDCRVRVPQFFIDAQKAMSGPPPDHETDEERRGRYAGFRTMTDEVLGGVHVAFRKMVGTVRFTDLLHLLADEDLCNLMRIEYPTGASRISGAMVGEKDSDIVRWAIANALGKDAADVTPANYMDVECLSLSDSEIADLTPLVALVNLRKIDLTGAQVSDLTPVAGLTDLCVLYLSGTQVSDLTPLKGLTNLRELFLGGTEVSDLTPLAGLTNLCMLYLSDTQVSDLTPLKGLANLEQLFLRGTHVSDLTPLVGLTNLRVIFLPGTSESDRQIKLLWSVLPNLTQMSR